MRTVLLLLYIVLTLVVFGIPALLVLILIGLFSRSARDRASFVVARGAMWIACRIAGIRLTVIGRENIPTDRNAYYIANHRSYFDQFIALPLMPRPCGFLSKKEFEKIPLLSWWMKLLHCVFLNRASVRDGLKATEDMQKVLEQGISLWVSPEGTRSQQATVLPFKEGSFRPAFRTGTPIVPVTIVNSEAVYELHKPKVKAARVTVSFGEPIPTEGLEKSAQRALVKEIETAIQHRYEELSGK